MVFRQILPQRTETLLGFISFVILLNTLVIHWKKWLKCN